MDLNWNEDQRIIIETARKFFEKETPAALVRELMKDEKGYSPEIWKKMSELGWPAFAFDEAYGGLGGSFLDLAVLFEEMGRAAVPTPFFSTVVLSGFLLQGCGSADIKKTYLPKIAEGECISTLAFLGKSGIYSRSAIGLEAESVAEGYRLNGTAFFVPYAHVADQILCAAKMTSADSDSITLFLVDAKSAGLEVIPLKTISGDGIECLVNLKGVTVTPSRMVGEMGKGWSYIQELWPKISAILSCECIGGMNKVIEMTINHVNERVQFGQPLSAFQIVQHMCVDMSIKAETSRNAAYYAVWLISEGLECEKEAAVAKAWCGEAYKDVTKIAHQVTGAIGFTEEYDLHLYTRQAKKLELLFGNEAFHRNIVADKLKL